MLRTGEAARGRGGGGGQRLDKHAESSPASPVDGAAPAPLRRRVAGAATAGELGAAPGAGPKPLPPLPAPVMKPRGRGQCRPPAAAASGERRPRERR